MEKSRLEMGVPGVLILFSFLVVGCQAVGPWCFACKDVFHPAICQSVVQCGEHELCHTEKTLSNNGASLYTTSCKEVSLCTTRVKRAASRGLLCDQCCNGTLCNAEGCGAPPIKTKQQLYCLHCDFVQNPSDCDRVDVCSVDKVCSVSAQKKFSFPFYTVGCLAKTSCPPPTATLAKDNNICCDTNLCNSNDLGVSPAQYTTTPIPTTRRPAKPAVKFDNSTLEYKVTHASNEKMEILCHVTGGPVPAVTWTFDNGTGSVPISSGISSAPNGDSILSVPDPDHSNSGKYTCNATNSQGQDQQSIVVTVLNTPKIDGSLNQSLDLKYQEDITLDCNVTMDNSTTVHWDIPPTVKSYTIHPNNSLTLYNVHTENSADYKCIAENADGNTTKSFSISVNDTSAPQTTQAQCTCPTVITTPCPTLPPTTTALTHMTTQSSTPSSSTIPSTTTTPTTSTTSTTTPSTTPSTTTTSTTTTTPTTSTTSTTTTSTTPSTTTPPTAMTSQSTAKPSTSPSTTTTTKNPKTSPTSFPSRPVHNQFQSSKVSVNILHCPTNGQDIVTWHRLINDFNHTNNVYIDDQLGVLTISNQMSVLTTGVYECRIGGVPVAQFVVYGDLPNAVKCTDVFGDFSRTPGVVIQAHCPPCALLGFIPVSQPTITDFICKFSAAKGLIQAYGGDVTYLFDQNGKIILLDERAGRIVV